MALALFFEAFLQRFHKLVETTQSLDLGPLFGAQMLFGELFQPVAGQIDGVQHLAHTDLLKPLEGLGEGAVELVEIALVLHHGGAGEIIETVDIVSHQPGAHAFQKGEVFAQGDRHLVGAQGIEEGQKHYRAPPVR